MAAGPEPFNQARTSGNSVLPDPFVLYSSEAYPKSMESVLRLCEYMWLHSGQFKMSLQRVVRYFLTKVEIDGPTSKKEKNRYLDYLNDHLNVLRVLGTLGDDQICYGNSFSSLYMPFNRLLFCSKCSLSRDIKNTDFTFSLRTMKFTAFCPRCKRKLIHDHKDMRAMDENKINIIRWNVHDMHMVHNFIAGTSEYIWEVDPDIKSKVSAGNQFFLRDMPWEVIQACQAKHRLRFSGDVVYHMKEDAICGVRNAGWGIPRVLSLFKDVFYIQLLKRYNEALALDYIVPFRVISPKATPTTDPLMHTDLSSWSSNIQGMLDEHRRDPASWHTIPFPLEYQALGGEGLTLAPVPLIKQGTADLMDAMGVPVGMYQGDMDLEATPMAMRLFESTWPQIPVMLNGWLQWLVDSLSNLFGWEKATVRLKPVQYADDIERKGMLLQLMGAQQISRQTAFASIGIDPQEEAQRIVSENEEALELQRDSEEDETKKQELQALAQGGAQAPGGMQPAGAPGMAMGAPTAGPSSPDQVLQQAKEVAAQLMGLPETQRRSQLIQLKKDNELLHAAVTQEMKGMTQAAATAGVDQMRQQATAASGAAGTGI